MADAAPQTPHAPTPHGDKEEELSEQRTLRDYFIILRERFWWGLSVALIVSVLYAFSQARQVRMYSAQATMQFEKPDTIVVSKGVVDQTVNSDADINTNLQILSSNKLRTKVTESFTPDEQKILQRAALKRSPAGTSPASVGVPLGILEFVPVRSSYLISVNVKHEDPEAAALVANRYVKQFMNHLYESAGGKNEDAVVYLKEQITRLQKESEKADQDLQQYMRKHNLISLDNSQNMVAKNLATVANKLTEERLALIELENQARQAEAYRKENKNLLEISYFATHGAVPMLKAQLNAHLQEQTILSARYLEKHHRMVNVAEKIAVTQEQLGKAIELASADLKTRLDEARQRVKSMEEEYARHEKENLQLRELSVDYNSLETQANAKKANYLAVLNRFNEVSTTQNLEKIPLHPLDAALVPSAPYTPNIRAITQTSIGLGVLVFLGVAIGLSFIDDRIKSAWDVESFIGVNLLGIIPDFSGLKDDEKYTLLLDNKQAPGIEAFLSVYSSVKINSKLDFPKSILITSTIPGEGKTLVSCNMAGAFARHGKKTLLIDCDLRRPMLHRHFKQQNTAGLITWFENGAALDTEFATNLQLGIIKVGENLSLLCSGGRSKTPTELLESPAFSQLLEKLKKEYDLVVVDSPPLGAVTDSLLIAERIDEVIYVCRFNRAYKKHIKLYIRQLRNGKNEILGIVLNGLSQRRIEYYSNYRYYRSYKKYYGAQT
jgi:polysaccharide biosynthesis transport protein